MSDPNQHPDQPPADTREEYLERQLAGARAQLQLQAENRLTGVDVEDLDDVVDAELVDEDLALRVGDVVTVTYRDPRAGVEGTEVVRFGQVVDVDDHGAVRVAYFTEVSDPIPADPTVHDRVDAPRVELVS